MFSIILFAILTFSFSFFKLLINILFVLDGNIMYHNFNLFLN